MYTDKSVDIVNEQNNTHHSTIKIKLADVKSSIYIQNNVENNNKDPKFEVGDGKTDIKTFLQKVPLQIGLKTFL